MPAWFRAVGRTVTSPLRPILRQLPPPLGSNRRGFLTHPLLREGTATQVFRLTASATTMTAIALAFGASPYTIGLLATLACLPRVGLIWLPGLVARYGVFATTWLAAWVERLGWVLVLGAIALQPAHGLAWALGGFGVAMTGAALYDSGLLGVHSLSIPAETRGLFYARRLQVTGLGGFVVVLVAGFFIDALSAQRIPVLVAPGILIVFGLLVSILALRQLLVARSRTAALRREPPVPKVANTTTVVVRRAHAVTTRSGDSVPSLFSVQPGDGAVIRFGLAWGLAAGVTWGHTGAFALHLMGLSTGTLSILVSLIVLGQLMGASLWGRLADTMGGQGVLSLGTWGLAMDGFLMMGALWVHPGFIVLSYVSYGFWNTAIGVAVPLVFLPPHTGGAKHMRTLVLFQSTCGLAAGCGPLLGAVIVDRVPVWTHASAGVGYAALFGVSIVARHTARRLQRHLPGSTESASARDILGVVARMARGRITQHGRRVVAFATFQREGGK